MSYTPQLINAFLLTVVLVTVLRSVAAHFGFLDRPDARKLHHGAVPLVGGVAMFVAFLVASISLDPSHRMPLTAVAGLGVLVAMGACDDRFVLRAGLRLAVQILAAALMVWPIALSVDWIGGLPLGGAAFPLAVLFVVGLANAFNMMDGLDGLAGGVAACALFWLALTAIAFGREEAMVAVLPLFFAVLGFLVFNMRHRWRSAASVFMGDAGSMMLGAAIAYQTLSLASGDERVASVTPLLWICALPAVETLSLVVRRLRAGRSPMAGDRGHLHHLLVDAGISPARAAAWLIIVSAALGSVGYAAASLGAPDFTIIIGLLLVAGAHSVAVAKLPRLLASRAAAASPPRPLQQPLAVATAESLMASLPSSHASLQRSDDRP
ncbi:MraY family glycosyltransferase [Hansschlegelia quercus]|nr:MraY family glycosyltransferase [Hansschlegelia quercus]